MRLTVVLLAVTVVSSVRCGTDDVGPQSRMVGGRCGLDADCVSRCLIGPDFPGGYCSVACATNHDCPGGAGCVAEQEGGVCLAVCRTSSACATFGIDYACEPHTSQSGGPTVLACSAPSHG